MPNGFGTGLSPTFGKVWNGRTTEEFMSRLHSFLASCLETCYSVERSGRSPVIMEIGVENPAIDQLLTEFGERQFVYMTAFNPQSTSLSPQENEQRQRELCERVQDRNYRYLMGWATPKAGAWDPERCIFVPGMSHSEAAELCALFRQDGAVVGAQGQPPRLLFTDVRLRDDLRNILHHCVLD